MRQPASSTSCGNTPFWVGHVEKSGHKGEAGRGRPQGALSPQGSSGHTLSILMDPAERAFQSTEKGTEKVTRGQE